MFSTILFLIKFVAQITSQVNVETISGPEPVYADIKHFWTDLEHALADYAPPRNFALLLNDLLPRWAHNDIEAAPRQRPEVFNISAENFERVKNLHHQFAERATQLAPKLPFEANTSGIVMTTLKNDIDMLLVALKMIRRSQTTMPVEVFLDTPADNQDDICNQVLPGLNAKCKYFSDIFNADSIEKFKIREYSYKPLSIMFSSFENVLFLDTDNIVVSNLDGLFTSAPFPEYGMVIWPDFWTETVAPTFFDIIGKETPENLTLPSAESGQLLISKVLHGDSLLLATYYNFYGRHEYYKLFTQNSHGEGDKDTYHNAAEALRKPYYRMGTFLEQLNDYKIEIREEFLAMVQFHPVDDYNKYVLGNSSVKVRRLFLHSNFCRFHVKDLMKRGSNAISEQGTALRVWADKDTMIEIFGYDLEKTVWESAIETAQVFHPELVPRLEKYFEIIFVSESSHSAKNFWFNGYYKIGSLAARAKKASVKSSKPAVPVKVSSPKKISDGWKLSQAWNIPKIILKEIDNLLLMIENNSSFVFGLVQNILIGVLAIVCFRKTKRTLKKKLL